MLTTSKAKHANAGLNRRIQEQAKTPEPLSPGCTKDFGLTL